MSLVLDFSGLEREIGESLEFDLSADDLGPAPAEGVELGPVRARGRVLWTGETLLVEGRAESNIRFTCSRCLETFTRPVSAEFVQEFRPAGNQDPRQDHEARSRAAMAAHSTAGGDAAGEPVVPVAGEEADLSALVWEALAVELPMKPVCRDECRGLCPVCGGNLNDGECGCRVEETDVRLLPLKKLLEAEERSE